MCIPLNALWTVCRLQTPMSMSSFRLFSDRQANNFHKSDRLTLGPSIGICSTGLLLGGLHQSVQAGCPPWHGPKIVCSSIWILHERIPHPNNGLWSSFDLFVGLCWVIHHTTQLNIGHLLCHFVRYPYNRDRGHGLLHTSFSWGLLTFCPLVYLYQIIGETLLGTCL